MPITTSSFSGGEQRSMQAPPDDENDRAGKKVRIKGKKGQPPIEFKPGGLHESVGVPAGETIPPEKIAAAAAGKYGPKAVKQAGLAKGLAKMRPEGRGTLPLELMKAKGSGRTLATEASAALVPKAVLSGKKKSQGGK